MCLEKYLCEGKTFFVKEKYFEHLLLKIGFNKIGNNFFLLEQ